MYRRLLLASTLVGLTTGASALEDPDRLVNYIVTELPQIDGGVDYQLYDVRKSFEDPNIYSVVFMQRPRDREIQPIRLEDLGKISCSAVTMWGEGPMPEVVEVRLNVAALAPETLLHRC